MVDDLVTIRDWLRWGVSRLREADVCFGHGTANAVDEAAFLILETLHLPIDQLEPWLEARLTREERTAVADIIERRISTRKPASYLTGSAYIQGHRFVVDERVIVPRSYIGELLCAGALGEMLSGEPRRVLDLCTGSGCLAILAALQFPEARVDAVELSADALAVARMNVEEYGLGERVRLLQGDLLAPVSGEAYDLIIANPPYVAAAEVDAFDPEYAAEPRMAHLGGSDGLDLVRRIVEGARGCLAAGGTLVIEVGTGRDLLEAAYPGLAFVWLDTAQSEGEVALIGADELNSAEQAPRRGSRAGARRTGKADR